LGGALKAPHMDPQKVEECFGERPWVPGGGAPVTHWVGEGAAVLVGAEGGMEKDWRTGITGARTRRRGCVWEEIVRDAASGKVMVPPRSTAWSIPGLSVSPVGVAGGNARHVCNM